jgi:hypothetical protein
MRAVLYSIMIVAAERHRKAKNHRREPGGFLQACRIRCLPTVVMELHFAIRERARPGRCSGARLEWVCFDWTLTSKDLMMNLV